MIKLLLLSIQQVAIWYICPMTLCIQTSQKTPWVSPVNFDQAMICNADDLNEYQRAYTNNSIDQEFFDFASEQYSKYIEQAQAYSETLRIPKIIHQIWIGPNNPPKKFSEWQQSWLELHPDWRYKLWTDKEVETLCMDNKKQYDQEKNYGAKADILRLEILYQYGGLYVDVDCECLKPFDTLHHLCDFYIGFFQINFLRTSARVNNAIMAAQPGHPLLEQLLKEMKHSWDTTHNEYAPIVERTGPSFVTKVVKQYIYQTKGIILILPANYFYPWSGCREKLDLLVQPETMAIHHYTGTWRQNNNRDPLYKDKQSQEYKKQLANRKSKKLELLALYNQPFIASDAHE